MSKKIECEANIFARLKKSAHWRAGVAKRFPGDPRNTVAGELLHRLRKQVTLTDGQWLRLEPYFDRDSNRWGDALTEAIRAVGFRPDITDFAAFTAYLADQCESAR